MSFCRSLDSSRDVRSAKPAYPHDGGRVTDTWVSLLVVGMGLRTRWIGHPDYAGHLVDGRPRALLETSEASMQAVVLSRAVVT